VAVTELNFATLRRPPGKEARVAPLQALEVIDEKHARTLRNKAGITSIAGLLKAGARSKGRQKLAEMTGISIDLISTWVHMADLLRVKGIGREYVHLLQVVGVDTVKKLQRENPENLFQNLQLVNKARHYVQRLPTTEMIADWIEQAKEMPRFVDD
jgi:DNA polymerase/3'-5' exonuclease PolX